MHPAPRINTTIISMVIALLSFGCNSTNPPANSSRDLSLTAAPSPIQTSTPVKEITQTKPTVAVVLPRLANLREEPNLYSDVVMQVSQNDALTVLDETPQSGWYRVIHVRTGKAGWIHGDVIKFLSSQTAQVATPIPTPTPQPTIAPPPKVENSSDSIRVWVNTDSGVYHCPGTRWYGNTKYGEYMTQREAIDDGNRPAYGNVCY